ncbi:hypothetical protein MVES_001529 [Malassezia vespertilionis]|uniref:Sec20 C-terminal domain-containing protein n=1 Tax=Malassezia vespertilionis TaxID=2020962 RepID=A0A2N1JCH6_9BASI|nr:hypothetical protein MVES_001529 [Malassezia vespertilionis]
MVDELLPRAVQALRESAARRVRDCLTLSDFAAAESGLHATLGKIAALAQSVADEAEEGDTPAARHAIAIAAKADRDTHDALRVAARRALLTAHRAVLAKQESAAREALRLGSASARNRVGAVKPGSADDRAAAASEDVTSALQRTVALMSTELEKSGYSAQLLEESSETIVQVNAAYGSFGELLQNSVLIIRQMERAELFDLLTLAAALMFFVGCVSYILYVRIVGRGIWVLGTAWKVTGLGSLVRMPFAKEGLATATLSASSYMHATTKRVAPRADEEDYVAAATRSYTEMTTPAASLWEEASPVRRKRRVMSRASNAHSRQASVHTKRQTHSTTKHAAAPTGRANSDTGAGTEATTSTKMVGETQSDLHALPILSTKARSGAVSASADAPDLPGLATVDMVDEVESVHDASSRLPAPDFLIPPTPSFASFTSEVASVSVVPVSETETRSISAPHASVHTSMGTSMPAVHSMHTESLAETAFSVPTNVAENLSASQDPSSLAPSTRISSVDTTSPLGPTPTLPSMHTTQELSTSTGESTSDTTSISFSTASPDLTALTTSPRLDNVPSPNAASAPPSTSSTSSTSTVFPQDDAMFSPSSASAEVVEEMDDAPMYHDEL